MFDIWAWILGALVLLKSAAAHPQCIDGTPPFDAETEFSFCHEYSHFGCCSESDDVKLSSRFEDLQKIIPAELRETCSPYFKTFICQLCSPYSSHIFDFKLIESELVQRVLPGLCTNYCQTFVKYCGSVVSLYVDYMQKVDQELVIDANILKAAFNNSSDEFCKVASLDDIGYCYPDILEEKPSSIEALTSDGCMCVQKMGNNKELREIVVLTHANDDSNRMFVLEERGIGHILYPNGDFLPEPFIDISETSEQFTGNFGNEPSVLGMAFHPSFKDNGLFYLYLTKYIDETTGERTNVLGEFRVDGSDGNKTDTEYFRHILDVQQQIYFHHGGQVLFGVDGYLYLFTGDGGYKGDEFQNSQNLERLLGKILRIDVDNPTKGVPYSIPSDNPFLNPLPDGTIPRPEIYAYGFRNPWRCGIDPGDEITGSGQGRIICGDVGQSKIEELDLIEMGANYGWPNWEASKRYCYKCKQGIKSNPQTTPIFEYNRTLGNAVIGGHFYRGCGLPNMDGAFVFGDFTKG